MQEKGDEGGSGGSGKLTLSLALIQSWRSQSAQQGGGGGGMRGGKSRDNGLTVATITALGKACRTGLEEATSRVR